MFLSPPFLCTRNAICDKFPPKWQAGVSERPAELTYCTAAGSANVAECSGWLLYVRRRHMGVLPQWM